MNRIVRLGLFVSCLLPLFSAGASPEQCAFTSANECTWKEVFFDACTNDWRDQWFLDGETSSVSNSTEGMLLTAGSEFGNDADHMVLWTKLSFSGDVKMEYDFARCDSETRCVNILYIQATGSGVGPYAKDISEWNELRRVPAMNLYFNHMNLFHVSYAAFPNNEDDTAYLRGRRYIPETGNGLKGTDLKPDYFPAGLFEPGVWHHVTVIKKGRDILMRVENSKKTCFFRMSNPDLPSVEEGRIGLRLMYTRSSLFGNIRICELE